MPKVLYPIPGIKDSVQRPVVFDIIRQMMTWTGISINTNIRFAGGSEKMHQPGSTISTDDEFNSFNTDPQWTVTVEEDTQQDRILSTAVSYDDNPHIFWDGAIGVYIRPVYTPVDTVISFSNRFSGKESAMQWRDLIRNKISMLRDQYVHSVTYSYLLPEECEAILKEIHRMREAVAPYGEDYATYFLGHSTKKFSVLTDLVGHNGTYGVSETQARVLGYFEIEAEPEKGSKDPESSAWDINITYKFKYDRPSTCYMEYPLVVHNQLMGVKFRPTAPSSRVDDIELNYSISSRALAAFETTRVPSFLGLPGIALPVFDEFLPAQVLPDTLRLITLMSTIDEAQPRNLLSLVDFDDYTFTDEILAFMITEAPYLNKPDASIFNVSVYRGENIMKFDRFEIQSDLMVHLLEDPSLREQYHVRVAIHRNPKMMNPAAKERLRKNYTVAKAVLWSLRPELEKQHIPGIALPGNIMTSKDFHSALEIIDDEYTVRKNDDPYQFNTVMNLIIKTNKRD